jgi:holo-[acyl-carrier protein] synthase
MSLAGALVNFGLQAIRAHSRLDRAQRDSPFQPYRIQASTGRFTVIVGLGIDLLENSRMERELARGDWLLNEGIFTREEIKHCSGSRKPALRYAARFAAKEATLKAMNARISDLTIFREIEVQAGTDSEYRLVLHGGLRRQSERLGARRTRLAIAGNAKHTVAMVILEG